MGVLVLAAARLAFAAGRGSRVTSAGPAAAGRLLLGALVLRSAPLQAPRGRRLPWPSGCSWSAWPPRRRPGPRAGPWPDASTGTLLAALALPLGSLGPARLADAQRLAGGAGRPRRGGGAAGAPRRSGCWPRRCWRVLVAAAGRGHRPPDGQRRQQPRPLLHVAGGDRHDPGQAGVRPGPGHDPRRLPELPLAGGAEPAGAAPARQRAPDRRRARACPAWPCGCGGGGGHGRRLARGAARRAAGSRGWRRAALACWPRSWWPGCSSTISATPRS